MSMHMETQASVNPYQSTEADYYQDIYRYKKLLARKIMSTINAEFVQDLRNNNFPLPKRLDSKACCHVSSHSTTDSLDLESISDTPLGTQVQSAYDVTKRVNKITEHLLQFEEKALIESIVCEEQLRALRSLNRGVLGKVLEDYTLFKRQHSLLIAINILMFNSSKMKIPKESFKELLSDLFTKTERKEYTIHNIKKSKTYSLLNTVIKSQF